MSGRWWTGIPATQASVECDGHRHTLRWEAGRLVALDHGDPEAEATLAALAGTSFSCLDLLAAWRRRRSDLRVLTLGPRDPLDLLDPGDDPSARAGRPAGRRPGRGAQRRAEEELIRLLTLGGGLSARLEAEVAATWARRLETGHADLATARPQLHAALYGRLLATLRPWLGEPSLDVDLRLTVAGEPRLIQHVEADRLTAFLPVAWLAEVWVRDLAIVLGRLTLHATPLPDGGWRLITLAPDLVTREAIEVAVREAPGG